MYILTEYLDQAMAQAVYDKLDDGTYGGRIPPCPGVVAFATSLTECAGDLRSTLEDWVLCWSDSNSDIPCPNSRVSI